MEIAKNWCIFFATSDVFCRVRTKTCFLSRDVSSSKLCEQSNFHSSSADFQLEKNWEAKLLKNTDNQL